uniref:Protein Mdm4 n=1 Tax=Cacopsylla melanoneura TaxID=428564 RepID=A0A8D8SM88_9HEMI
MATLPPSSPGLRRYHYVLEPETLSEDGDSDRTNSVYSMQDRETEYVRDESDTCTKSDVSEYTLYSQPSEKDSHPIIETSSSEDFVMKTKTIVVETFLNTKSRGIDPIRGRGSVDEYDSSLVSGNADTENDLTLGSCSELGQVNYRHCAWCNRLNVSPTKYRYCMKCFLMRKEFFPRKPKATKKRPEAKGRTNNKLALCADVTSSKKRKRHHSSSENSEGDPDRTIGSNQAAAKSMKLDTFIDKFGNLKANSQIFSNISMEDEEQLQALKKAKKSNDCESSQHSLANSVNSVVNQEDPDRTLGSNQAAKSMKLDTFIDRFGNMKANSQMFSNICTDDDEAQASKKAKKSNDSESTIASQQQPLANSVVNQSVVNQSVVNQSLLATSSTPTSKPVRKCVNLSTSSVFFRDLCEMVDKVYEKALQENEMSVAGGSSSSPDQEDSSVEGASHGTMTTDDVDHSALCIMCDKAPKNGAFVHPYEIHVCCCYRCALKVWKQTKKCPACTLPACNVLRVIVS